MADDLAAWLRECITQDVAVAQEQRRFEQYVEGTGRMFSVSSAIVSMAPHRAVAECEAKMRIIELHKNSGSDGKYWCEACGDIEIAWGELQSARANNWCLTLRLQALPYADWPGYRAEWKP